MKTDEEGLTCRGRSIFLADEFQVFLADFTDLVLKKRHEIKLRFEVNGVPFIKG